MTNKEKSQPQIERDFKKLVLDMLPENEKDIISQISAGNLYYLVFGTYNTYSGVRQMINSLYENLNPSQVYGIIISLRNERDLLKSIIK